MVEVYAIYNKDTRNHVADIIYNSKEDKFYSHVIVGKESPIIFANIIGGKIIWGGCENPSSEYLEAWLKDRVIPYNREMLKETLAKVGIYEYNWRELIKINKGQSVTDEFLVEVYEKA